MRGKHGSNDLLDKSESLAEAKENISPNTPVPSESFTGHSWFVHC